MGSAPVGTGPSTLAINPATHTIYVANGYNDNGPQLPAPGNTVSVINARDCQAQDVSRCKGPWPTITVGNMPSGIAIDKRTDTVYVTNVQDNTVSVFNGATCNAETTSGCGQTPATVPVGLDPLGLFADPANHTVYVPDYGAIAVGGPRDSTTVSMLDSATCNATDLAGCPTTRSTDRRRRQPARTMSTSTQTTHTVYVTTLDGSLNSGWRYSTRTPATRPCNQGAADRHARPAIQAPARTPPRSTQRNNTLYTANYRQHDLGVRSAAPATPAIWPAAPPTRPAR